MLSLLGPFGARARDYPFPVRGWVGRAATAPAVDVEVTVPGLADPAREVVIGCHYDGEADSTAISQRRRERMRDRTRRREGHGGVLGRNHLYPARTLRFVLFDAEEQGLFGSYEYVNKIARNDLPAISAMINEEQNGIAYPLRYLGRSANPLMPFFAYISPLSENRIYPHYAISARQRAGVISSATLVQRAAAAAFGLYRAMGYQMLTYHSRAGNDIWRAGIHARAAGERAGQERHHRQQRPGPVYRRREFAARRSSETPPTMAVTLRAGHIPMIGRRTPLR